MSISVRIVASGEKRILDRMSFCKKEKKRKEWKALAANEWSAAGERGWATWISSLSGRTEELGAVNSCVTMPTYARLSASVSDISQSYQQDFKLSLLLLLVAASCMDEYL